MKKLFTFLPMFVYLALLAHPYAYGQVNALSAAQSSAVQNYIVNGGFENARHGWVTYKNTAQALPVTGAGGTASTTLTTSTSSPIAGKASGLITHPASNVQGEGISYAFQTDKDARGQSMQITGSYEIVSGTYSGGTGLPTITDSDLEVYVYDVDAGVLIQPAGYRLDGGIAGVTYQIQATFQPQNTTTTNYRLIIHAATTSTNAFVVRIDSLKVARMVRTYATSVTDWTSFTPTGGWTTNTTYNGYYRRVGDSIEVFENISLSGAPNTATLTLNIPNGLRIDTTKLNASAALAKVGDANIAPNGIQAGIWAATGVNSYVTAYLLNTTSGTNPQNTTNTTAVDATHPQNFASGNGLTIQFKVPILGWSSSTLMSDSADSTVLSTRVYSSAQSIPNSTNTQVIFQTVDRDVAGTYSTTTGLYTARVPGFYTITASVNYTATSTSPGALYVYKNGVNAAVIAQGVLNYGGLSGATTSLYANAGDTFGIWTQQQSGGALTLVSGNSTTTYFTVLRASGPSQVASTETVAARYSSSSGQTIGTSATTFLPVTKVFDTHGAFNSTTGVFTCPTAGKYKVIAILTLGSASLTTSQAFEIQLYKNGSAISELGSTYGNGASSISLRVQGSDLFQCVAGDGFTVSASSGVAAGLFSNAIYNYVEYLRVGN